MNKNTVKIFIMIIIFLGGLYFYTMYTNKPRLLEGLTTANGELRCPNLLIQKELNFIYIIQI